MDGTRRFVLDRFVLIYTAHVEFQGPQVFYVDGDGTRLKGDLFSVGSGSTHAYGVLDQGYHWDLTDSEAQELGRRSIYAAGHRDAFSGNTCNLYHIKEDGWHFIGTFFRNSFFVSDNNIHVDNQATTTLLRCIMMARATCLVLLEVDMDMTSVLRVKTLPTLLLLLLDRFVLYRTCINLICQSEHRVCCRHTYGLLSFESKDATLITDVTKFSLLDARDNQFVFHPHRSFAFHTGCPEGPWP